MKITLFKLLVSVEFVFAELNWCSSDVFVFSLYMYIHPDEWIYTIMILGVDCGLMSCCCCCNSFTLLSTTWWQESDGDGGEMNNFIPFQNYNYWFSLIYAYSIRVDITHIYHYSIIRILYKDIMCVWMNYIKRRGINLFKNLIIR